MSVHSFNGSQVGRTDSEYDPLEDAWDDWSEEEQDIKCLFCKEMHSGARELFEHMRADHHFDFIAIRLSLKLDFYQCIRLINYVRQLVLDHPEMEESSDFTVEPNAPYLEDDEYMKPVLEEDPLLYAFDDFNDGTMSNVSTVSSRRRSSSFRVLEGGGQGVGDALRGEQAELLRRMRLLEMSLKAKEGELARAQQQHHEYRQMVKEQFYDPLERSVPEPKSVTSSSERAAPSDYYFNSYAHYEIHEQMLKDRVRTESYRDFMYENKSVFKDKVVLDVGCGTGILSMFAARSGARRVIAVDNSDIIHSARQIAKENGFDEEQLTFVRGKIEEIDLPVQSVDIIISEWMGYFLLFESMLDSVLTARDKYMAPDGFMAPSGSSIHLTLLEDEEYYNDRYTYWNDVYGFKMLTMQSPLFNEAGVDVVDGSGIISDSPCCLRDFNLNKVTVPELDFTAPFSIPVSRDARLHAFVGYFDIDFRGESTKPVDNPITFSTSAKVTPTHWKQTIFPLREPLSLEADDLVQGVFTCKKSPENPRELVLHIAFWVTGADGEVERVKRTEQTYQLR